MDSLDIAPAADALDGAAAPPAVTWRTLASDLVELTKPRIALMVALTAATGLIMATPGPIGSIGVALLFHTVVGTALVAAGAGALNQVVERSIDARMRRTANRPLPSGRIDPDVALTWGVLLAIVGIAWLAAAVNLLTAVLGGLTLAGYVFVYTPMKRLSSLATVVGAVPGAVPPMMGWTAARDALEPGAWVLFGILFLWQLPHFLAIAWMFRRDYAAGGLPMLPVNDPSGVRTGRQSLLYGAALVPVALLPTVLGLTGLVYFAGALALSLAYLAAGGAFALARTDAAARRLLLASVLYLPALLAAMLLDRAV
ncbi:MAG TPA: heme o synthase [Thermoanaerobaculia bacterium]|nr:heme o synthase [Thermoanaerobaculia bacterium]